MDLDFKILDNMKDRYMGENRELLSGWHEMEKKAQNTIAFSSVFLIGIVTILLNEKNDLHILSLIFISLIALFFILAIGFAAVSLFIQKRSLPLSGDTERENAKKFLSHGFKQEEGRNWLRNSYFDICQTWAKSNDSLKKKIIEKSDKIFFSQICVVISLSLIGIMCFCQILYLAFIKG